MLRERAFQIRELLEPSTRVCRKFPPLRPGSVSLAHALFRIDPQAVGDAVDVVEVGNHLHGVVNRAVCKAGLPEVVYIGGANLRGTAGKPFGKCKQRPGCGV